MASCCCLSPATLSINSCSISRSDECRSASTRSCSQNGSALMPWRRHRPELCQLRAATAAPMACLRNRRKGIVLAKISEVSGPESHGEQRSVLEPRARLIAKGTETYALEERGRPLAEYMSLPASQYSVLDAERIERVANNTFRCYVYKLKFFSFEVCPVLVVRVDEQPDGCIIRLLSCTLEGSPIVVAQNEKFAASMVNRVSWKYSDKSPKARKLISDATIEVTLEIPFAFRAIPVEVIESAGNQVLGQVLRVMLPRFLSQLVKDYHAWASGDTSRRPLGTGEI